MNISELKPNIIIGQYYKGELMLPSWAGFQSRQGSYASKNSNKASDGLVKVFITGKEVDGVKVTTAEQVNAVKYLIDNADNVRDALLLGLLHEMPGLEDIYEDLLPEVHKIEDFQDVIGLANIHLMESDKEGFAYVGFELGCNWDEDHGVGVMMHKDRVVAVGQATTAFDCWVTFDDNGTTEVETKKWHEANEKLRLERQKTQKKWWKFW
ncbi:MAG: hypothetical protein SF053_12810 [Bacteroidia bacterium]|nr:hypothetical protein [Bacteroidia bacterium]